MKLLFMMPGSQRQCRESTWRRNAADYRPGVVHTVRGNLKIDWMVRENVRAEMRVMIKRILRRYGYPPDKQTRATSLF